MGRGRNKQTNKSPPVFYGTSSPSGPLPKTWELLNSTDVCFNKQGRIQGCPSCLRVGRGTDKKVHKGIWAETVSSKKLRNADKVERGPTVQPTNQPTNQETDGHTDRWTKWRVELCSTQLKMPSELGWSMCSQRTRLKNIFFCLPEVTHHILTSFFGHLP